MKEQYYYDSSGNCEKNSHKNEQDVKAKNMIQYTNFIPNQIAPDNWPFFEARCNPLSSKGITGTDGDYNDDYS